MSGEEESGYRYWDADPWDESGLRRPDMNGKTISIAVCGAGDGALQDFLRIVTGLKSAKDLMLQLDSELP